MALLYNLHHLHIQMLPTVYWLLLEERTMENMHGP